MHWLSAPHPLQILLRFLCRKGLGPLLPLACMVALANSGCGGDQSPQRPPRSDAEVKRLELKAKCEKDPSKVYKDNQCVLRQKVSGPDISRPEDDSDPADPDNSPANPPPSYTGPPPKVLLLGDSITAGWGAGGQRRAYPEYAFPRQAQKILENKKLRVDYIRASVPGSFSNSGLPRLRAQLHQKPTHVLLALGYNDYLGMRPRVLLKETWNR